MCVCGCVCVWLCVAVCVWGGLWLCACVCVCVCGSGSGCVHVSHPHPLASTHACSLASTHACCPTHHQKASIACCVGPKPPPPTHTHIPCCVGPKPCPPICTPYCVGPEPYPPTCTPCLGSDKKIKEFEEAPGSGTQITKEVDTGATLTQIALLPNAKVGHSHSNSATVKCQGGPAATTLLAATPSKRV